MEVLGQLQGPAAGVKTVTRQTEPQLREILPELRKQSAERLQFAVLFLRVTGQSGITVRALDELASHGQGQTSRPEQFRLQDLMEIDGVSGMTIDQTMRAMRSPKRQMTGGVKDHDKSTLQAGSVQGLHADKTAQHAGPQPGIGSGAGVPQEVIQGIVHRPRL